MSATLPFPQPVSRENLSARAYAELRDALLEGRLWPGQRLKFRELAAAFGVSETPVREAVMQLVREGGLELRANSAVTVVRLTVGQYLELRRIRLELEGLAGEAAAEHATPALLETLRAIDADLRADEAAGDGPAAVRDNWRFHQAIYRAAEMPELLAIIERLWLRNGPLLNFQYPLAPPTYPGRHRHLDIIDALAARKGKAVRAAIRADTVEGGARLLELLRRIDSGETQAPTQPGHSQPLRRQVS